MFAMKRSAVRRTAHTIILASASPQRKKLLQLLGLRFTVKPSAVCERARITTGCAALVKHNALIKARDIARRTRTGIVIGADTLVYLGKKKVMGKPRTVSEAKKMLQKMCRQPQWVYTGVAVIDAKTGTTLTGHEKTKVFMMPMSAREIDRYYRRGFLLDKAGGFDIQGRGGLFIRRVEGCYYNVIGLPLATLCRMLKKVGVQVLILCLVVSVAGCTTEYNLATQQQETLLYGTAKEVRLGDSLAGEVEEKFDLSTNGELNARVKRIGRRLADVCDRKELVYIFKIIDDDEMNAVSLPGGYVYIFRGLIDELESDDQLAAVIAHEVGHITAKHSVKKIQGLYGYSLLMLLATQTRNAKVAQGIDLAFTSLFMAYSREDEFLADALGIKYMEKAGYDPEEMVEVLKTLLRLQEKRPLRQYSYWRTHPYLSQRIAAANQEISGELGFTDYLNLIGEEQ